MKVHGILYNVMKFLNLHSNSTESFETSIEIYEILQGVMLPVTFHGILGIIGTSHGILNTAFEIPNFIDFGWLAHPWLSTTR